MPTRHTDPPAESTLLTRREALARTAAILGSALAAPTIAGVLAGCGDQKPSKTAATVPVLKALSPAQEKLVAAIADVILPATDTPGARDVGVSLFVDRMLADYYPADAREKFLAGLARLDAHALTQHGHAFVSCTATQQFALVDALDAQLFDQHAHAAPRAVGASEDAGPGSATKEGDTDPRAFYGVLKELTLAGYYTSEAGATRELRANPMGRWRADVPYTELRAAWA
jgi:gluconate 2-dehydrogenase gamma chain